ncbi:oxidoreductase [Pseudomonas sp. NFACC07-1]|uniref:oxidoreductase n=1 Tax=Pseudomonas sp. NFACC07-1 TaxID=1566239 RepID=UPI0008BF8383|nr:oxidoreductase [Pseudomonas sp. NFACC07-1]SEI52956.1 NADP-dependent 3-hydroxy acid dehydrogenase YdfG [Pseudomonas sp. NFACC07-1]
MTSSLKRNWLITGVSSGFGRILAQAALARGDSVAGTLRRAEQIAEFEALAPGRAHGICLDVTDFERIPPAIAEALAALGHIDILVNNAGYGLFGAIEEASPREFERVMDTNFTGPLRLIQAVLPHMRSRGKGNIINFSSLAGVIGMPGVGLYCSAKFALEGMTESLAAELAPFGIEVTLVEPGGFRTNFAGSSLAIVAEPIAAYDSTPAGKTRQHISSYYGREPGDPVKGMQAVLQMLDAPKAPLRLVLGADAVKAIREKLARATGELEAWESVSVATALDPDSVVS